MAARKNKPGAGRPHVYATELPVYDTMEQCFAATGVPTEMLRVAKKNGCTGFHHGRVHFSEFVRWWFNKPPAEEGSEEDNVNWEKRDKRASALMREAKLQEQYERVIDFSLARNFVEYLTTTLFFGELERYKQEFPAALKGKSEVEIQEEMTKQMEIARNNLTVAVRAWVVSKGKKKK